MTKPLPSLSLEMSRDGISLHQLAFDGHWHELARVGLNDAALRERLSNMRSIAIKLEGRGFKTQLWLPSEQIVSKNLALGGSEASAEARSGIAAISGGKASEFAVQIGAQNADKTYPVAAVRIRTLHEAKAFAKSHGFSVRGFGTRARVEGFSQPPHFEIPVDKVKTAGLGLVAIVAATVVLAGGYAFYTVDPFDMWEIPPRAADFAPFQQPNPGLEHAGLPPLPSALSGAPVFQLAARVVADTSRYPLPYIPPRQLTAEAQEVIIPPAPVAESAAPAPIEQAKITTINWPAIIAALPAPASADGPPAIGFITLLGRIAPLAEPKAGNAPPAPLNAVAGFVAPSRPITVANTAFFLEPLPAMATRLSPDAFADLVSRSGLTVAQLSRMASPLLLMESKVVDFIPGLPPIPPLLRSGRALPAQVARAEITADVPLAPAVPSGPAPLFSVIEGQPDIQPPRRPVPPVVSLPENTLPFEIVSGAPDLRPVFRPVPTPVETPPEVTAPADTPAELEAADTNQGDSEDEQLSAVDAALAAAVEAAVATAAGPQEPVLFALVSGQPPLLPRLRSGAEIPPVEAASAPVDANISPAAAEANALRPRRRPQAIIELTDIIDPMISGAAPASATRPSHRNAAFAANVARIVETVSSRPRATAPAVPADPQSVNLPTSASVARSATIENAINLRTTNLIGVFGAADARTALIRLSGGRLVRVQLGQSFSGWTVVAISEDTVRIRKRNREEILRMPAD